MADGSVARPEWRALEIVHELAGADVSAVSPLADWDFVAATRFRFSNIDVDLPTLGVPAFGINYGAEMRLERTMRGRQVRSAATPGHLSLLPPDDNSRWLFDKPGDIMLVVLNRTYLNRAIEQATGWSTDVVEIKPQFVIRDLTLERIAHQLLSKTCRSVVRQQAADRMPRPGVGRAPPADAFQPRSAPAEPASHHVAQPTEACGGFHRGEPRLDMSLQDRQCRRHEPFPFRQGLQAGDAKVAASVPDRAAHAASAVSAARRPAVDRRGGKRGRSLARTASASSSSA